MIYGRVIWDESRDELIMAIENIYFGGPQTVTFENEGVQETIAFNGVLVLTENPSDFLNQHETHPENISKFLDHPKHGVSTDGIIPVNNLFSKKMSELGDGVLLGLEPDYGIEASTIRHSEKRVLVAGEQFGRGSSREQAVWALLESGIAAVIAPSFGSIFQNNAAYSGLLTSTDLDLAPKIHRGEAVPLNEFTNGKNPLQQQIIRSGGLFKYLKKIRRGELTEPVIRREQKPQRGMNIFEQRLAKAFGTESISPGDVGLLSVNTLSTYPPLSGPMGDILISEYGELEKSAVNTHFFEDHFLPDSHRPNIPILNQKQRKLAQKLGIPEENYHHGTRSQGGGKGIIHRVMLEWIDPRSQAVVAVTDSHTPTLGALPILALPLGSTIAAVAIAEGKIPFSVGKTIKVNLLNSLPPGHSIRDAQLELAATVTNVNASVVEFGGDGLNKLSFEQVAALCNMVPEVFNAEIAVTEAFAAGINYLQEKFGISSEEAENLYGLPEEDCEYEQVVTFDLGRVIPWIALPGNPNNAISLSEITHSPTIDKAYLVSCTLGLQDLVEAAAVLKDQDVSNNTRLIVIPSSQAVREQAEAAGILKILEKSGAEIFHESYCGPCIGEGESRIGNGEVGITASNRNFVGRMGSKGGDIYMGSPSLAALSAMMGRIPTAKEYGENLPRFIKNQSELNR